MKNSTHLLCICVMVLLTNFIFSQTARVQIIHNSADVSLATVDVYLDGTILLENFAFRTATPFIDAPAGNSIRIDIAPSNSTSSADSFYNLVTTLTESETYILVANGIVSASGYSPNQSFDLAVFPQARETASNPLNTDVLVCHGATDAPIIDIVNTTVLPISNLVNNISYPSFNSNYLELPTSNYTVDVTDMLGNTVIRSFDVFFKELNLDGQAITVVASGFLNPSQNSSGSSFGLWVALSSGGNLIELNQSKYARVQIIHNSADLSVSTVDVYINKRLVKDDFSFRTATPYLDLRAEEPISIDIAPSNSTSGDESIYNFTTTFAIGGTYIIVANGILSTAGYSPNTPFEFSIFNKGRETSYNTSNTDVLFHHGSTDATAIDITEISVPVGEIADDISYLSFTPDYVELPTANYTIDVSDATETTIATYQLPLETLKLKGESLLVVASGFINPSQNSDGPSFGLWASTVYGGNMIELPLVTLNAEKFSNAAFTIFPNPVSSVLTISNPKNKKISETKIIDSIGRTIKNIELNTNTIDVSNLPNGFYILSLGIEGKIYNQKFVVRK